MNHQAATVDWAAHQSRFEFAPPRHFLLPAILLLVSEKPGYGYSLVKDLYDFRFGQVERPAVYRALAQLEGDGLVKAWDEPAKAGQARKVYGITEQGARVLRAWMGVIKEERDCLDNVLHRYQASGTADAALAQVEGAWPASLGHAWSSVSSTCASGRRRAVNEAAGAPTSLQMPGLQLPSLQMQTRPAALSSGALAAGTISAGTVSAGSPVGAHVRTADDPEGDCPSAERLPSSDDGTMGRRRSGHGAARSETIVAQPSLSVRRRFRVVPDRSVVLIEARSTVGPIRFGAMGLTGSIEADYRDGEICCESVPSASLIVPVDELRSGNGLYDAELLRRIDARRFPKVSLTLQECTPIGTGDRYRLAAEVLFHGVTRPLRGTVGLKLLSDRKLVVTGDHALDVRDFQLPSPTVLMLRIYPDVRINLHVEAELED
jgi:PadR family transcriptional regulator, regulatory protein PadR